MRARIGPIVTLASTGIGLCLGILYAWSVIRGGIPAGWGWSNADKALPYSVACLVFALTMVPAGRLQDRLGPRWITAAGGLLAGAGLVVAGLAGSSLPGFIAGFGVLTGIGIGFGYAAITPAAIAWFPPERTGLVTGIVVAGFGLAPVYVAPLTSRLVHSLGVSRTLIALGCGIAVVVSLLAQLLRTPAPAAARVASTSPSVLRSPGFYLLWTTYFCGAAAGLMFIGVAQELGKATLGAHAFVAVAVVAVGNAGGRVVAGVLSDRIGRASTLIAAFLAQAVVVALLWRLTSTGGGPAPILVVLLLLGLNYGANLALYPAAIKDRYGLRGFGLSYGLLFTAWGAAGLIMPWVSGRIVDLTGKADLSYAIVIGMLIVAAALTLAGERVPVAAARREPLPPG
jgi:MFS transporter, OFA family, oxalate/formate antiporter